MQGIRSAASLVCLAAPFLSATLAVAGSACPADADGSKTVDFGDVALILLDFGACAGCASDLDGTGIEMVLIPPGSYQRGCTPSLQTGCASAESPVHQVTLTRAFYLGRYEVTQAQWTAKMCSNPSQFKTASDEVPASEVPNRPVEKVSFNGVKPFLTATGFRLPTEAEWEFACRAGTTTALHGSAAMPAGTNDEQQFGDLAWTSDNSGAQTRPVGGKAGNGFGVHDMAGNVWEFVADWYGDYTQDPQVDPAGPASGTTCIVRGGGFDFGGASFSRSSYRSFGLITFQSRGTGFRVARNP